MNLFRKCLFKNFSHFFEYKREMSTLSPQHFTVKETFKIMDSNIDFLQHRKISYLFLCQEVQMMIVIDFSLGFGLILI